MNHEDLDGKQVECLKMFARVLQFCMTEMKLMMVFICVGIKICWWISCCGRDGAESGGNW